jgi:hypothetical protein
LNISGLETKSRANTAGSADSKHSQFLISGILFCQCLGKAAFQKCIRHLTLRCVVKLLAKFTRLMTVGLIK